MPTETINSIAFEVTREEQPKDEKSGGIESWEVPESKELTTNMAEARAGEVLTDIYKVLGPELTSYLLETKENKAPVIGVNSNGMVLFPETGTLVIPHDIPPNERINALKLPVASALDMTGDWVLTEVQRPEISTDRSKIDIEEGDDSLLTIKKISEKSPLGEKDVKKMRAQVMRALSGALPTEKDITKIEINGEDGNKITAHTEKNDKGKTELLDPEGRKVKLTEDDVKSLYAEFFKGPASGEEPLGIETAFPSSRGRVLPEELETKIGDFPEIEEKVSKYSSKKPYGIYMELEAPVKAVNRMLAGERKYSPLQLPANEPGRLPEAFERTGIIPVVIGVEGKVSAFYDERKNDIILCLRNPDNTWVASRLEKIPEEKIESLWTE